MRYIYVDESKFSKPNPCIGTGMLISDEEINDEIIKNAITDLHNDPDRHEQPSGKLDDATLNRGYFHACKDSKNAHSHLLDKINKSLNSEFISDFHNICKKQKYFEDEIYYKLSFINSTFRGVQTRNKFSFFIEDRHGLNEDDFKKNHKELENNLLLSIYDLPIMPIYFPEIKYHIVGKENPGVQCADFLLWTVNRRVNGDNTWYDRINSSIKSNFLTINEDWGNDSISIGNGIAEPLRYYDISTFPKDSDSIVNKDLLTIFFIHAVKIIEYFVNNPVKEIAHLQDEINIVAKEKLNLENKEYLDQLFSTYLKLFDMVPLINKSTSKRDKEFLLLSKKYLSLPLRRDLLHGVSTRSWFQTLRRNIINHNVTYLEFSN